MSNSRTAEEAKQDYINHMGEALGKYYHALWKELSWLYSKWDEYEVLFGTKPSRIELMNNAAPRFFRMVQDSLWEETILHIARLTDSKESCGKKNLSIQGLPDLICDNKLKGEINTLIDEARKQAEFCRDWRNRRIAHRDLKLAIEEGIEPLMPASRKKVKDALKAIAEVLNSVTKHYSNSTTMFDMSGGGPGCALSLLCVIKDGLKAEKERTERIKKGEYKEDDLIHEDI